MTRVLTFAFFFMLLAHGCDRAHEPSTTAWGPWQESSSTLDGATVRYRCTPWPIPVGRSVAIDVEITHTLTHATVLVDASMPHHGHGMNVSSPCAALEPRSGTVQGAIVRDLLFHMPGRWQVTFDLDSKNGFIDRSESTQEVSR
ncbi:MAG: hypothetical protein O2800_00450 [Planctomycetota bacterium]|nr:hypothetical protein [Planctomycetota bacterium]